MKDRPLTQFEAAALLAGRPVPAWANPDGKSRFGWIEEDLRPLCDATGWEPLKSEYGLWRKQARIWAEVGATADIVREEKALALAKGMTLQGPQSLTAFIKARMRNGKSQSSGSFGGRAIIRREGAAGDMPELGCTRNAEDF